MNTQTSKHPVAKVTLDGVLAEFKEALIEEINQIKKSGQSSTLLCSGKKVENNGPELWYRFNVEYAPTLPADTPCKLFINNESFDVTVISVEENAIILAAKNPLPDNIGKARLENGSTVLMERLIRCIEDNAGKKNPFGNRMLLQNGEVYSSTKLFSYNDLTLNKGNTESQNEAIISALTNDITYIWGPPGTGKTTVIGQIIDELYKKNRSVLIVSHTNTAVDGAIEKADRTYSQVHSNNELDYPILRIGVPARPLPDRVLMHSHVEKLGKELYERKSILEKDENKLQRRLEFVSLTLAKDSWVKNNKLEEIADLIQNISSYEKQIEDIQAEIEVANNAIKEKKSAHPEYSIYLTLAEQWKEKKSEYDHVFNQLSTIEKTVNELPPLIQNAVDEIKKHDKHSELSKQASKYIPIRNELQKTVSHISALTDEISLLKETQKNAEKLISDYEQKNAVAKLFSGKTTVTQAHSRLQNIKARLPQAEADLLRQQELEKNYKQQIHSLFLLQEQIKAVVISKTKEYWQSLSSRLQNELRTAKHLLPSLSLQKDALFVQVSELEQKQNDAKTSFYAISELENKLQQFQSKKEQIQNSLAEDNNKCTEYLKKEYYLCKDFFYAHDSETNKVLFEKLSQLLIAVKNEIESINIPELEKEKELVENNLIEVSRELNEIKRQLQDLEKQAIMAAQIIGATLAKSYLSDTLRSRKFDTVILDEASMASFPALWCACYLAESSVVIVGDFLQLPPIVMAETPMAQKWLGKDVFYHSGMQEAAKNKSTCPENFIMLNDQFRMESDIANIANMYYGEYGGLRSHDTADFRIAEREKFYEWYVRVGKKTKRNIHLIDTENLNAWVTGVPQGKNHSRLNCFSASVDVALAFHFLENKLKDLDPLSAVPEKYASVLIVAPYKPHITRINQLIDFEYRTRGFKENLNLIRAGTIHSFQGSEADIVIFDLVIDEPHWKANLFIKDKEVNDDLRKMFNVAITRAKYKLYIVGNFAYCQKRAKDNALSDLLNRLINKHRLTKIDAKELFPKLTFTKPTDFSLDGEQLEGKQIVCRESSFYRYFMTDIRSFKERMIIYSPFITSSRLTRLLPAFTDAINEGKQITVVTKALSERKKTEFLQYQRCEQKLREIGVSILHKKGMHEKLIFVDSEAVWIGSLNALSFSGKTGEVMQRHADKVLASEYEKLFDIKHIRNAIENTYEQNCPICKQELLIKESNSGGIYWRCIDEDCKYSRKADQPYPQDGILRCKCGEKYKFEMKKEPRWVCSANSKHYQKMKKNDLELKQMMKLIPKKDLKEVHNFFKKRTEEKNTSQKKSKKNKASKEKPSNIYTQLTMFE